MNNRWYLHKSSECPNIYRKSVLHLLMGTFAVYLSRCSTDLRYVVGLSVYVLYPVGSADPVEAPRDLQAQAGRGGLAVRYAHRQANRRLAISTDIHLENIVQVLAA